MNTFYRKVLQVALVSRNGGSIFPEGWLSLTGTVAHFDPEYSPLIRGGSIFAGDLSQLYPGVHTTLFMFAFSTFCLIESTLRLMSYQKMSIRLNKTIGLILITFNFLFPLETAPTHVRNLPLTAGVLQLF